MGVCRVCRGCVGWVCQGSVSRVCGGRVAGVSGVCRRGVSRACAGCAAGACWRGVSGVCPPLPARRGFLFFSACGRPRGLPLFRVFSAVPHPSGRPLGTSSSCFPGACKDTQDRRASAFRRAPRTSLLFAVAVLRDTRNSNFHPPAKNTPPPLGDPPHGPEWMPGVHLGVCALGRRPPSCALGCCGPAALSGWFSTAFQTVQRQGGASQRRARRCL